jgi:hypothetical protein
VNASCSAAPQQSAENSLRAILKDAWPYVSDATMRGRIATALNQSGNATVAAMVDPADLAFRAYNQGYRDGSEDSGGKADLELARDGWHDWLHDCEALKVDDDAFDQDDDGCPHGDPECLSDNGDCHDGCSTFSERDAAVDLSVASSTSHVGAER